MQGSCICCTVLCPAPAIHALCTFNRVQSRLPLLTLLLGILALLYVQSQGKLVSHR